MRLLIIGPQASGKGTQAERLAKRLNVPHLSSGDMFRAEQQSGSELGKKIGALINAGELVPDDLTWAMVRARLAEHPSGWILDGYPRTMAQAELLDAYAKPEKVLVLEVSDAVCIERIAGRRICPTCGRDYHVKYKPPKKPGFCDDDNTRLIQRPDDTEEAVQRRLATYHEQTEPILERYADRLVRVNGEQGIEEVWSEIQEKLGI